MRDQYDLYGGFPPHVRHSDTSLEAAYRQLRTGESQRALVYQTIERSGESGLTDDDVERATGLRHQTASARRRELVQKGFVEDSGDRRKTSSGCRATVWVAVLPD
jgi:hypothetical protein